MRALICLVAIVSVVMASKLGAMNCKPTINGKSYDFSSLANSTGSFTFPGKQNGTVYNFQLQVCANVANPLSSSCTPSPVLQVSQDGTQCYSLGDSNVYAWDMAPSGTAVMLQLYHGDALNDIERRSTIIYFGCARSNAAPFFEHERICYDSTSGNQLGGQYHFTYKTNLAC